MKYLLLFLALGLGYEGYTHWSELQTKYTEVRQHVAPTTAIAATSRSDKSARDTASAVIPQSVAHKTEPSAVATPGPVALSVRVADSQRQAVAKYPALSTQNSEMNSRFVFRYKRLLAEKSPRLQDPTWPMQLADECNEAIAASKPKPKIPVTDKLHQTASIAAAGQTTAAH